MSPYARYLELLRKAHARQVIALIRILIDHWEKIPNDVRGDLELQCPAFCKAVNEIHSAMDSESLRHLSESLLPGQKVPTIVQLWPRLMTSLPSKD